MFITIDSVVAELRRNLSALKSSFALVYAVNGPTQVEIRMTSNIPPEHVVGMLTSMFQPTERGKDLLIKFFTEHPLQLAAPVGEEGAGLLRDVPPAEAASLMLALVLTNLQLAGAKPVSSIIVPGGVA